jgi:hypothetical protein
VAGLDISNYQGLIVLFVLSLFILVSMVVLRFKYARVSGFIAYKTYSDYVEALIDSYLHGLPKNILKVKNERIINSVINEASALGNTLVEMLKLVMQICGALIYFCS